MSLLEDRKFLSFPCRLELRALRGSERAGTRLGRCTINTHTHSHTVISRQA